MRINYLDGLRGVAILLVIVFHAYSRWPEIMPYGNQFEMFPLFKLGWLGVQLFFLISGFVIFMSLDRKDSFTSFIYKRWVRLFPAMLIASFLIFFTAPIFHERPAGNPSLLSLLPGLTFIEPSWWGNILGLKVAPLEGAFWSLYVEFKFYVVAGAIYFFMGRKFLAPSLIASFVFSLLFSWLSSASSFWGFNIANQICSALSFRHFGWFSAGLLFYLYHQSKNEKWLFSALAISILSSITVKSYFNVFAIIASLMIVGLFSASFKISFLQRILEKRLFIFFGFISYPLYLIHENAMVSMIIDSPKYTPWLYPFFYPFLPITVLTFVAYSIAKFFEPKCRELILISSSVKFNKAFQRTSH